MNVFAAMGNRIGKRPSERAKTAFRRPQNLSSAFFQTASVHIAPRGTFCRFQFAATQSSRSRGLSTGGAGGRLR